MTEQKSAVNWRSSVASAVATGQLSLVVLGAFSRPDGLTLSGFAGLLSVPALVGSLLVGLLVSLIHQGPLVSTTTRWLASRLNRYRLALTGPFALVAFFCVAKLSVELFSEFSQRPRTGGILLSLFTVGLFSASAWLARGAAQVLAKRGPTPSLTACALVGLVLPVSMFVGLVAVGTVSGQGAAWTLFGVLRRPELHLLPVFQGLFIALSSYLGALLFGRLLPLSACFGAAVLSLGFSFTGLVLAAQMDFRTAVAVERSYSLAKPAVALLQQRTDRDGDGVSGAFGGGDCDDMHANIHPGAEDLPGNGLDEDCSGTDRKLALASSPDRVVVEATPFELPKNANFLLLTIDTLRADLGYARQEKFEKLSPNLDALAKRSIIYEKAYSLASYTSKSLGPMLLGRYPSESPRTFEHFDRFSAAVPFVQERLQKAGIRTVSVQGYWYFFLKSYGFERGWDVLDSVAAPKVITIEGDKSKNGDKVADQAITQLEALGKSRARFFMWTHWVDPHAEYVPHEAHDYGSESRERYDGEVSFVDEQVGRVLEALSAQGLSQNTVVMVTSDHGEAFNEHGMIRHGFEVWEELVHVPLLLFVPGAAPRTVKVRRSLIDTVPTILETFQVSVPTGEADFVRGTSLYRDARAAAVGPADKGAVLPERPVLVDMVEGPHNKERRAFYTGAYKIITSQGRVLGLYDLVQDPGEKTDLSEDRALTDKIQAEMNAYLDTLKPVAPSGK